MLGGWNGRLHCQATHHKHLIALLDAVVASPTASDDEVAAATEDSLAEFDFSAALDRLEGDRDLLIEQMIFYLEDSPILVRNIEAAVERQDGKKLQLSAHRLRGLSAGFDAQAVVNPAAILEQVGRDGNFEDAALPHGRLRPAWERTCAALKAYMKQANRC